MKLRSDVVVVGAGASGLTAALVAVRAGARVLLIEQQDRAGRKIRATGNGRCNLGNAGLAAERYHGADARWIKTVLSGFDARHSRELFHSLGVPLVEEADGRIFPSSLEAACVPAAFEDAFCAAGGQLLMNRRVENAVFSKNVFSLTTAGQETIIADRLILACGGMAAPQLGAGESGYALAASFGHTVGTLFPAIIPLNTTDKRLHRLQGQKWDVQLTVKQGRDTLTMAKGELLFTAYGISGPVTLDVSRVVNEQYLAGQPVTLEIDFFPDLSRQQLAAMLHDHLHRHSRRMADALGCLIKSKLALMLCDAAGLEPDMSCAVFDHKMANRLAWQAKGLVVHPGAPRSFNDAAVTAGGVSVDEVDPATMCSLLQPGLYLCGELLDVDGDCGGFNLQFAWSSGALAGSAAVR